MSAQSRGTAAQQPPRHSGIDRRTSNDHQTEHDHCEAEDQRIELRRGCRLDATIEPARSDSSRSAGPPLTTRPRPPRAGTPCRCGRSRRARVGGRFPRVALDRSRERRRDECSSHRAVGGSARDRIPRRPTCARRLGETFYWAGVRSGTRIELAATDGTVFIRYLPRASRRAPPRLRSPLPPIPGRTRSTRWAAPPQMRTPPAGAPQGGLAVADETGGTNVHLAFPGRPSQVEVYSPKVAGRCALVANGKVRPTLARSGRDREHVC